MNSPLLGALIGAAAVLVAQWFTHIFTMRARSSERQEIRRIAMLDRRAQDLRQLGELLTEMVAAAQEVIWERISSAEPMPRSDPRAMRLTNLTKRSRFLRLVVNDPELEGLARKVAGATTALSDAPTDSPDKANNDAAEALQKALDRVAVLLREAEQP